ncbi:MAG: hypothetical protein AAGA64_11075 [Bacteroidota bacterium]
MELTPTTSRHLLDLNFSTSINLSSKDNDRFQTLYSTQVYDTFFTLMAKFEVDDLTSGGGKCLIKTIEFLGINYKGPINIKIEEISLEIKDTKLDKEGRNKMTYLYFDLKISGTERGTFSRLPASHPGVDPVDPRRVMTVNLEVPHFITFRIFRTLRTMNNIEEREGVTDASLIPRKSYKLPDDAFWNGIFDSEFFYRDGFYIEPTMGLFPLVGDEIQNHENGSMMSLPAGAVASSINCPIGVGNIYNE